MPSDFVHLHVHTEFSLLDGQSKISHVMKRAQELEMPAVGISDHGVMFGVIDFAKKAESAGIKPVIGMEAYLAPRGMQDRDAQHDKRPYHLLLWAENQVGYRNLLKIASASQLDGYYYRPRIDRAFLADHAEGIIATSGCLAAQVPRLLEEQGEERAREMIGWYQEVFGAENFFLELQPHDIAELKRLNAWLLQYRKSGHTPVQLLATNDMHYVRASDTETHDVLLAIQTGALVKETNRMQLSPLGSYYMKSADEMRQAFAGIDEDLLNEAFANTLAVAERCKVSLKREKYHLPLFPVPQGMTEGAYLRHLAFLGLSWRFPNREDDPILQERLERELFIIDDLGFNTYFLIVWDLCMFARSADIWWNVRGSGAGSLVAYCLGITNLDPIQNSLLFERFLNPGRKTMPDIDLDYPDDRRGEMIAYAVDKYGEDKVAAIITFGTMGAKAAVRDVARVLDVPLDKVNRAVKLIPTEAKQKPIMEYVEAEPDLKRMYQTDPELRRAIDTAVELQGLTRHASTHAAGVIIADAPLVEYLPLHRITGTDPSGGSLKSVTQFPMETAEEIGLLKVDFLGLSTLTILRKACELIERHHGIRYTMDNIPYRHDDDNISDEQRAMLDRAFEMMGRGDTVGVFQVESSGMQSMLRDMRPKTFEHIIAGISLYRPGPMDFIPLFNRRMHGEEAVHYHHERLAGILGETYGICLTGDTLVYNAQTGISERLDALGSRVDSFMVQAVNEAFEPVRVPMTAWYDNGVKPVYELRLQNGACVKATADHRFLTEDGWRELQHLTLGSYIATPAKLYEPIACDDTPREKLRVLAYLLADGGVSNMAQVNFFSKSPELLEEYERCLGAFEDVQAKRIEQVRSVNRIVVRDRKGRYENSLLAWMRALGLKNPSSAPTGGKHSHDKFIPDFVFALSDADVAFFLASLWDCDGYMGNKFCHYKTISRVLAYGVQTLLLRLGIESSIYAYTYQNLKRGQQTSYQVSVYDTRRLADYLQPHMMTSKRLVECTNTSTSTLNRRDFIAEVYECTGLSARKIMATYKIDRQHFYAKRLNCEHIGHKVVQEIAETVPLPETKRGLCLNWNKVVAIEPAGEARVYDITVPQVHNFVANNILVHNCVYQEQIMQIAGEMFGYSLGEADLMRRAVSKKKDKDLLEHRALFRERAPQNGISVDVADKIFDDIVFFANYGFNKCVVGETQIVDADTGRYVTVEDLYYGRVTLSKTLSLDTETLQIGAQAVTDVMFNGVKPVYRLTTRTGRTIEATDNHPFYTFEGWKLLRDVAIGEHIAGARWAVYPSEIAETDETHILWDEVVEVVYVGEKPTYDLTIENTHNFIANGIVVHNSHASDYAVITVQTAYLKCHYPHEYMTALLSVQFDDSDKVATFLEECRRLNIPILPPDINASQLEFDIERLPDGRRGVRFGLSAVKNAGVNALNVILEARQEGGAFTSLLDLCHRVDLHKVGKRALECLIKVGALEAFGERDILLESLERIMTASTTYHRAKQSGQKSLFGEEVNVGMSEVTLVTPKTRVARRDMLMWEKELLGLYVTGRPVDKFAAQLRHLPNLLNVAELRAEETFKARAVNVAGEVVGMRRVQTKSHETMVVMQIEDWHESAGTIEVVLFPKTWEKVNITFQAENDRPLDVGEIVLVRGTLDNKRGSVQVIADSVTADFDVMMPDQPQASYGDDAPAWMDKGEEGQFVASSADEPPPLFAESAPPALAPLHTPSWANAPAEPDAPALFDDDEGATLPQKVVIAFKVNGDEARDMVRFKRLKQALIAERGTQAVEVVLVYEDRKKRFKMAETVDYSEKLLAKLQNIDNVQAIYLEDDKA